MPFYWSMSSRAKSQIGDIIWSRWRTHPDLETLNRPLSKYRKINCRREKCAVEQQKMWRKCFGVSVYILIFQTACMADAHLGVIHSLGYSLLHDTKSVHTTTEISQAHMLTWLPTTATKTHHNYWAECERHRNMGSGRERGVMRKCKGKELLAQGHEHQPTQIHTVTRSFLWPVQENKLQRRECGRSRRKWLSIY